MRNRHVKFLPEKHRQIIPRKRESKLPAILRSPFITGSPTKTALSLRFRGPCLAQGRSFTIRASCAMVLYACPNQPHARDLRLSTVRCQANDKLPPSGQILTPCSQAAQVFILLQLARLSVKHFLACVRSAAALRLSVG